MRNSQHFCRSAKELKVGLKYKMVKSTRKEVVEAVCDKCGKRMKATKGHWNEHGTPNTNYFDPSFHEDFFELKTIWGYGSARKDGETHTAVLCEPCYDEVFKDVK